MGVTDRQQIDDPGRGPVLYVLPPDRLDPESVVRLAESRPDYFLELTDRLDPGTLAESANRNPELFARLLRAMPGHILHRLVTEHAKFFSEVLCGVQLGAMIELMNAIEERFRNEAGTRNSQPGHGVDADPA